MKVKMFHLISVLDVDRRLGQSDCANDTAAERDGDVVLLGV